MYWPVKVTASFTDVVNTYSPLRRTSLSKTIDDTHPLPIHHLSPVSRTHSVRLETQLFWTYPSSLVGIPLEILLRRSVCLVNPDEEFYLYPNVRVPSPSPGNTTSVVLFSLSFPSTQTS